MDRNSDGHFDSSLFWVALRKESVDRNTNFTRQVCLTCVALRKESVDRNRNSQYSYFLYYGSLSARRAWIEIIFPPVDTSSVKVSLSARRAWIEMSVLELIPLADTVALRKESVDRNQWIKAQYPGCRLSLSARRAWIEIDFAGSAWVPEFCRSPQGERG